MTRVVPNTERCTRHELMLTFLLQSYCGPHFRGFMQVPAVSSSTGHVPTATSSRLLRPVAWPEEMSTLHPDPYQFREALRVEMEHAKLPNAEMASAFRASQASEE